MTDDEYQAIDEQVARLVFGWWEDEDYRPELVQTNWYGDGESYWKVLGVNTLPGRALVGGRYNGLPYFSEDMSAAWKVVEKLESLGFEIMVGTEDDGWEVEIITTQPLYEQGHHGVIINDNNPARAICRAAIRVMTRR